MKRAFLVLALMGPLAAPVFCAPPVLIALATDNQIWGVGTWDSKRGWREIETTHGEFRPGAAFGVYDVTGKTGGGTLQGLTEEEHLHAWSADVTAARGFPGEGRDALALSGTGNRPVVPRRVRAQSNAAPVYVKLVKDWLAKNGLRGARPRLTQTLRVDLDGAGRDEVLIAAASRPQIGHEPHALAGDYTLVWLRAVGRDGQARTFSLAREIYHKAMGFSAPTHAEILACADINGDGRMEIVLSIGYYEGFGLEIWTWDGKTARRALGFGAGV